MHIRNLEIQDAELMLEWMHDKEVVEYMNAKFASKTIEDCRSFIKVANAKETTDVHWAIVNDDNEYLGTVSLKEVDLQEKCAEFAITVRKCAMGKGYASQGMKAILQYGFEFLGLEKIVWCVSKENIRANRFYVKNNYTQYEDIPLYIKSNYENTDQLNWFVCFKD